MRRDGAESAHKAHPGRIRCLRGISNNITLAHSLRGTRFSVGFLPQDSGKVTRRKEIHPSPDSYNVDMWPQPERTQQLIEQAKTGAPGALDQLLAEFREPLRRVIGLRLDPVLSRRIDASDIVQDVLLEANQRLNDYLRNPTMPFHLWLRHLAQDRIIDTHRRHRQAQRRSVDREQPIDRPAWVDASSIQLVAQLVDTEQTPASAAIQQELQRRLESALTQLNEDDRDIILMRHHEQLSNQDVAAALGLNEAAASMRYLRALRKLRAILLPEQTSESES